MALGIAIAISSCSIYKPYKDVAADSNRDSIKRNLLAPVCAAEFPVKVLETKIFDSSSQQLLSDNVTVISQLKVINDSLLKMKQRIITVKDSADCFALLKQYDRQLSFYAHKVDSLAKEIKLSVQNNRYRFEQQKILDSAAQQKLRVDINKLNDVIKAAYKKLTEVETERDQIQTKYKKLQDDSDSLQWLLLHVWRKLKWWLIAAAAIYLLLRFKLWSLLPIKKLPL
jgi:hypothetical protein